MKLSSQHLLQTTVELRCDNKTKGVFYHMMAPLNQSDSLNKVFQDVWLICCLQHQSVSHRVLLNFTVVLQSSDDDKKYLDLRVIVCF